MRAWCLAVCVGLACVAGAMAADAPVRAGGAAVSDAQRQAQRDAAALGRASRSSDTDKAWDALVALAAMGEPAHAELRTATAFWLDRDERLLKRAGAANVTRLATMQKQMDAERAEAWSVIDKLSKDNVAQARAHYDRLVPMQAELGKAYAKLAPLAAALARREELLTMWRATVTAEEVAARDASEASLIAEAEAALGMTAAEARACQAWHTKGDGGAGVAGELRHWFACRAIDQFNADQARLMSKQEQANAVLVNEYRAALGILPMEWDARLIQAARRHSKEMSDLDFFAHESPTPANKTHTMRMKNAGHPHGTAENIAAGSGSGEAVFWMWFNSPGHHKNMVGKGHVGIGVGQWGSKWTQNFGGGPRLAAMSKDERENIEVKGDVIKPQ